MSIETAILIKKRANFSVTKALREGTIKRQPCEVCGKKRAVAHHPNYRRPLLVIWLCQKHHLEWHANLTACGSSQTHKIVPLIFPSPLLRNIKLRASLRKTDWQDWIIQTLYREFLNLNPDR